MIYLRDWGIIYNLVKDNNDGIDLWICDYRLKQSGNQKLRDITPTRVRAVKIENCTSGKMQMFSWDRDSYLKFYLYTKTGKISKNSIELKNEAQYDHDGAYVFLTEEEATDQYNCCVYNQIKKDREEIAHLKERLNELESKFINTDIVMETLTRE
jgi:hypothetical protein